MAAADSVQQRRQYRRQNQQSSSGMDDRFPKTGLQLPFAGSS